MKKTILFSCALMTALVACYKDEAILNEATQDPLTKAKDYLSGDERVKMKRHKITTERAMQIAQEAKTLFADENERMIRTRSIGTTLAPVVITTQSKTRAAGGIDTLMYVVNYSNNDGYVFVSNDDRDGEILMYSGGGNFAMQDTAGNTGLKLHVEMMLAYQQHKLNEMKAAEAQGEEYKGSMTTDEVSIDECLPNILTTSTKASGLPGMPGHTCNVTGQAGMPGSVARKDICAPATYVSKDWFGGDAAIDLAQNKYKNQKCFGVPVSAPNVKFTILGAPGIGGSHQDCFPYCSPHIRDYEGYYNYYGCKMEMKIRTQNISEIKIDPLVTVFWDQDAPLKHGTNSAGCGPIAVALIMLYHNMPKTYISRAFGGTHRTEIDELRKLRTNEDITNSPYKNDACKFMEELRVRLNVEYFDDGSTSTYMSDIIPAFRSFGYIVEGSGDYYIKEHFNSVSESIMQKKPVFVFGRTADTGHFWVLDGYKKINSRNYYADYYFDENGRFNAEKRYNNLSNTEYVHVNYGWGAYCEFWVERGVYVFYGTNYDHRLSILTGIQPKN